MKGGQRSVKPLCKSGFQSSDGRCRKKSFWSHLAMMKVPGSGPVGGG